MRNVPVFFIASVWLINGLFCKLLHMVPRHQQIVARILGTEYAPFLTKMIGLGEVFLAMVIITGFRSRQIAWLQVLLIAVMNLIEIIKAPDLLLFGRLNGLLALAFIIFILYFSSHKTDKSSRYELTS
jgi:hypothetical protein